MKDKQLALKLLVLKREDKTITLEEIAKRTGYSKRHLIRISKDLNEEKDMEVLLQHANTGREPYNKALDSEIEFLRSLKKPYPNITIAQFRDIYLEDVIFNPKMKDVKEKNHLKPRSKSWFRDLFRKEGWKSPSNRKPLRRDGRAAHPLRKPAPRRGMLVQIDGTPFDWFNNGEMWTLHLAVDDATSEVLAGYFMPTERQLGYCYMMRLILNKYGLPMALYSDRHSIFHSPKEGNITQFGMMMEDLGIELIGANSPQAKGRVERYNGTVQRRLPNDIIRFGVKDYSELNIWFNEFYIPYINRKFAFTPLDPNDAYIPIGDIDLSEIFVVRLQRVIHQDSFSLKNVFYAVVDENGEILHIRDKKAVDVRIDIFTEEVFVLRYGSKFKTKVLRTKDRRNKEYINDYKELDEFLSNLK